MPEIVKAGPNTAAYPMHAYMYEEIVAWEKGVAAEAAMVATQNRYKNYLSGPFKLWWTNYDAGRDEEPAPTVPEGFDAQLSGDGLAFDLIGSGAPCGPVPLYKKRVVTPNTGSFHPTDAAIAQSATDYLYIVGIGLGESRDMIDGRKFVRIK